MKKVINILSIAAIFISLSACVQVTPEPKSNSNQLAISSVRDLPISFPQSSLFSLSPRHTKETSLKPEQVQVIYQIYANAIIEDLQKSGFIAATSAQSAAFHVGFGVALSDDFSDEQLSEKFGVTPGLPEKDNLNKGSFLIYIDDAVTGHRVWRGIAQGFVHEELTPEQRQQRTSAIVASVLKQFYHEN